jgi:hypothetical protein
MTQETFSAENLNEHARKNREREYKNTADPLFMEWKRGEIEEQVWLDAVQGIKNKFPYHTKPMVIEIDEKDIAVTLDT